MFDERGGERGRDDIIVPALLSYDTRNCDARKRSGRVYARNSRNVNYSGDPNEANVTLNVREWISKRARA